MPDRSDISPLSITNGKISKAAKIDPTKLAPATSGQVLIAGTDGKFRPGNLVTTSSGDTVAQGPAGPPGATGSQGATGATGATGADADVTEAAVDAAGAVMHTDFPSTGFIKRGASSASYTIDNSTYALTSHNHTLSDITDSGTAAPLDVPSTGDAAAGEVVKGNDSRLVAPRVPTVHTHYHFEVIGLGDSATKDVGASSDKVAAGDHTHAHSDLTGVDVDEHLDWTSDRGTTNIHAGNYTDTTYTAGDGISLSGTAFSVAAGTGLTQNGNGLELNLQGVADAAIKVDDDYLVFLDGGSTGAAKKESLADLATAMAGTGLTANSGELVVSTGTTSSTVAAGDQGFAQHKVTVQFVWGTNGSGPSANPAFSNGANVDSVGTFTHNFGTKDIIVSVRSVNAQSGSSPNFLNKNYLEDELTDVGFDPFRVIASTSNTLQLLAQDEASSSTAGTWAITIIG